MKKATKIFILLQLNILKNKFLQPNLNQKKTFNNNFCEIISIRSSRINKYYDMLTFQLKYI